MINKILGTFIFIFVTNFSFANKTVTVTANLKGTNFKEVPIEQLSFDIFGKKKIIFDLIKYDSVTEEFKCKFTISRPQLMLFFLKEVFVTPGDSINVKYIVINSSNENYRDTLIIKGKNAGNYSYYTFTRNEYTFRNNSFPKFDKPHTPTALNTYEVELSNYFKKLKQKFYRSITKVQHSKEYRNYALSNLYLYENYFYLTALQQTEGVGDFSRKLRIKKFVNNNIDTGSHYYFAVLRLLPKQKFKEFDFGEFYSYMEEVNSNQTFIKDYLIYFGITEFIKNKRHFNSKLSKALQDGYNEIDYFKYRDLINYADLINYDQAEALSASLLSSKLIDKNGKSMTLNSIIDKYQGFFVYLDFWASWCIPCREETEALKFITQRLSGKPLKFLQISIDADSESWLKAVREDNIDSDQFKFSDSQDFRKIYEELKFIGIPYYLILDKSGLVIVQNAPRPSDENLARLLMQLVK